MPIEQFSDADIKLHHNTAAAGAVDYPAELQSVLGADDCNNANIAISNWPGYQETPLRNLDKLAAEIGVAAVHYKDEGPRFGLGSFKALGGAYAVMNLLAQEVGRRLGREITLSDIAGGEYRETIKDITVVTATDGNHGRSVAWGAEQFGCPCRIYMHAGVSKGRADAVEAFGATVVWVDGNYDASVKAAADDAGANEGWFIVSDTSYEGYMELPRQVMAGYTVMTAEIARQLDGQPAPTHVFLQGGVGGLAGAVVGHLWQVYGADHPRFVIVEPEQADCLLQSAVNGKPTVVDIQEETVMAGLSCGEVSLLGWEILSRGTADFMTIPDNLVGPSMRLLADGSAGETAVAGESAVAGLAAAIALRQSADLSEKLGLDSNSRILVIGTEGATDPAIYREIVGCAPEDIAA